MKIILFISILLNFLFSSSTLINEISYDLKGDINKKYNIIMRLNINMTTNEVLGTYWYLSNKTKLDLDIVGEIEKNNKLKMVERFFENGNYNVTGYFDGKFEDGSFIGTWYSRDRKITYPFRLTSYFPHKSNLFSYEIKYQEKGFKTLVDLYVKNDNNKTIQTIKKSYFNSPKKGKLYNIGLHLVDINFDGYLDMVIVPCFVGCYDDEYYLYDLKSNNYKKLELPYDGLISDIDLVAKVIETSFTDGKSDIFYRYKYENGKFYKIYKEVYFYEFDNNNNYIGGKVLEEKYEISGQDVKLIEKIEKKYVEGDDGRVWIDE